MGLISQIKSDISRSGSSREKILYIGADKKVRIRFLNELDDGYSFVFHQLWDDGINCLCPKELDEDNDCMYCNDTKNEKLRTYKMYAWSVYNFETSKVEIALFKVNRCSPVQQLIELSENYGTIMDRDYVIAKKGSGFDVSFTVIPQDKSKFKNAKALPFTREAMLKILNTGYPYNDNSDDDDDEVEEVVEEKPRKKYAMTDEELPTGNTRKKSKKASKSDEEATESLELDWMEEQLEDNDIDVDEFLEYNDAKSLKKFKDNTKKQFNKYIKDYLASLEDDDEDDDEDDYDDEDDE